MTSLASDEYLSLASRYSEALRDTLPTLRAVVAIGGLARAESIFWGWSDIDLLVVLDVVDSSNLRMVAELRRQVIDESGIAATIVPLTVVDVTTRFERCSPANSVILNALSGRPNTARLLHGTLAVDIPPYVVERANAVCYVDETLVQMRRLAVATRSTVAEHERDHKRAIRWTASILRAALRTRNVYALPYEPSVAAAMSIDPHGADWSRISEVFAARRAWCSLSAQAHSAAILELTMHAERVSHIAE